MDPNRFLTLLPKVEVIAVGEDTFLAAQDRVRSCELCDSRAITPFSSVIDELADRIEKIADYLLPEPAKCRNCDSPIIETTLVCFESRWERPPAVYYRDASRLKKPW